jgi:hypothetical protein
VPRGGGHNGGVGSVRGMTKWKGDEIVTPFAAKKHGRCFRAH